MTTNNTVPRFRQLDNLVGRDSEIQLLQDAYQRVRVSSSSCEAILVHGESGTGKTALVNHSLQQQREDGTLISGKFDVIHSARPYSAIVDALKQVCQPKAWTNISKGEEFVAKLQERLGASDLEILFQLIPAIKRRFQGLKVGNDNKDDERKNDAACGPSSVDSTFAFARLAKVMRTFVFLAARYLPSPLVLFLDDVQAADQESLSIISSLSTMHSESQNLLMILAYRDQNEDKQMAQKTILSHTSSFRVTRIEVGNLNMDCGNRLIGKLLGMDPEVTRPLSRFIIERTDGNTYFTLQFLEMLKDEKLLDYCFKSCKWIWNVAKIRAVTNVTDNVAHLLTSKIQQLPPDVQSALQLAACLGFYFDLVFLERIVMQQRSGTVSASAALFSDGERELYLKPAQERDERVTPVTPKGRPENSVFCCSIAKAVEEHLIDPVGGTKYKFTHDRVLQASYEMISAGSERAMLHWRIGEVLWTEFKQQQNQHLEMQSIVSDGWLLFATADQLNRGADSCLSITDNITRFTLAKLNLDAGKAAFEKSAFKHAAGFFDKGVNLMKDAWHIEYSLCLELYTRSVQAEYAASNFDMCDQRVNKLLENGRCLEDLLPVYLVKIKSQGVRGRILEAIDESVVVLHHLGVRIPRHPNRLQMLLELAKTKRRLKGKNIADLLLLPDMTSQLSEWATKFLRDVRTYAWFAQQMELVFVAACLMVQLTVKYGVSSQGPSALACYGGIIGSLGDLETAYETGTVALELAKRSHTIVSYATTISSVGGFINHLKQPVTRSLDLLMDGYNVGTKLGDVEGAAMCLSQYTVLGVYFGKKLDVVISEMEGFRQAYGEECERNFVMRILTPWYQLVLNLMGRSEDPLQVTGAILCEEAYLTEAHLTGNEVAISTLRFVRMIVRFLFGDVEAASNEVSKLGRYSIRGTHFGIPFLLMYAGLTMLGVARKTRKRKYLRQANMLKEKMVKFVKAGNLNMPPILELMLAEQASLQPRCSPEEVKKRYESAVRVAAQSGFSVVEAIGYERAGEYMLSIGDDFWAKTYEQQQKPSK